MSGPAKKKPAVVNSRLRKIDFPTVLFPGVYMTVHVGEPLLPELALLGPGDTFVLRPEGNPLLGCLCRLEFVQTLVNGANYKMVGLHRVVFDNDGPWATNLVISPERNREHPEVLEHYHSLGGATRLFPGLPAVVGELHGRAPAGIWMDLLAFHLPLSMPTRVWLLAQADVLQRARMLAYCLEKAPAPERERVYQN